MSQKLTFAQRAERLAEAAKALRDIGNDLAWIADTVVSEADAMAAARERFASQRGQQPVRAAR
jgi:hypothetical protein